MLLRITEHCLCTKWWKWKWKLYSPIRKSRQVTQTRKELISKLSVKTTSADDWQLVPVTACVYIKVQDQNGWNIYMIMDSTIPLSTITLFDGLMKAIFPHKCDINSAVIGLCWWRPSLIEFVLRG